MYIKVCICGGLRVCVCIRLSYIYVMVFSSSLYTRTKRVSPFGEMPTGPRPFVSGRRRRSEIPFDTRRKRFFFFYVPSSPTHEPALGRNATLQPRAPSDTIQYYSTRHEDVYRTRVTRVRSASISAATLIFISYFFVVKPRKFDAVDFYFTIRTEIPPSLRKSVPVQNYRETIITRFRVFFCLFAVSAIATFSYACIILYFRI